MRKAIIVILTATLLGCRIQESPTAMARNGNLETEDPVFRAVPADRREFIAAVERAQRTAGDFRELIKSRTERHVSHMAKLEFYVAHEGDSQAQLEPINLWLTGVTWDGNDFHGELFEVPSSVASLQPGDSFKFRDENLLDWMVNDNGVVWGAFSIRLIRDLLPASERNEYDEHIGARRYVSDLK